MIEVAHILFENPAAGPRAYDGFRMKIALLGKSSGSGTERNACWRARFSSLFRSRTESVGALAGFSDYEKIGEDRN